MLMRLAGLLHLSKKAEMVTSSSILNFRKTLLWISNALFWLPMIFLSLLLIWNTIPYFNFSKNFDFIRERAVLFLQPLYSWSFYLHIAAGMFCMGTALLQFSSIILKKQRGIHVWAGRIYVFVVLFIGAPTGMYMSFFAKGSGAERGLFMFMALSWFAFTAKGLTTILKKNVIAHKCWMIRSYAMATTAITFRLYYIILYVFNVPLMKNYEISLWMSVLGNLLISEAIIFWRNKKYLKSFA